MRLDERAIVDPLLRIAVAHSSRAPQAARTGDGPAPPHRPRVFGPVHRAGSRIPCRGAARGTVGHVPLLSVSSRSTRLSTLLAALGSVLALLAPAAAAAPAAAEAPPGVWPLRPQPAVVHGFDPPDVRWGSGHRGVDLAGRVGQPVLAALPGIVSFAGRVAGRGVVVVDHGATRTTYQPVTASVGRGARVGRGEVIGTLAWFGTHCLPAACLHWGLVAGETYLDPLSLVGGPRPVRLLPVSGAAPVGSSRSLPSSVPGGVPAAVAARAAPAPVALVALAGAHLARRLG